MCQGIVQKYMDKFAKLTGRQYHLFDYVGPLMQKSNRDYGFSADTVHETVDFLNKQGRKTGVIKVRLFRPFSVRIDRRHPCNGKEELLFSTEQSPDHSVNLF